MRVRYTRRALSDLQSILGYLDQRSPGGARNVKRAIQKTIELIGEFPSSGRQSGEQTTRVLSVGRYPYLIYWSVDGDDVWLVHIRHARRKPWISRSK